MTQLTQSQRLKFILNHFDITQQQLAAKIGVSQSAISQVIKSKTTMSLETVYKISQAYGIDCNWMVLGIGEPFMTEHRNGVQIMPITVDADNNPNIVLVPVKAQAGYALHRVEADYIRELPAFSLPIPQLRQGTFRAFEVDGDSMEPTLFKGDLIICRYVEDRRWMRDFHLYVIVLEGDVLVKRVINHIKTDGKVDLLSDNRYYPPMTIDAADIVEVWTVFSRFTLNFASPPEGLRDLANQLRPTPTASASEDNERVRA